MDREEIKYLHDEEGKSFALIGKEKGVSRQRIHQIYHGNRYYYKRRADYADICRHHNHLYQLKRVGKVKLNKDCPKCGKKGEIIYARRVSESINAQNQETQANG